MAAMNPALLDRMTPAKVLLGIPCATVWVVDRVGIRELKQNASAVIRRVLAGETIEVTDHGRPVARIVPLRAASVLDQLVAEGRATAPDGDLLAIAPLRPRPDQPALTALLAEERASYDR
jgi:prevent-host-death family protein